VRTREVVSRYEIMRESISGSSSGEVVGATSPVSVAVGTAVAKNLSWSWSLSCSWWLLHAKKKKKEGD